MGYIAYAVKVQFYRSGLITVSGARLAFPWHEGWVRWNDQKTWYNVFALAGVGLYCLLSLNYPTGCVDKVIGSSNRSTDRWAAVSEDQAVLAHTVDGASFGWGNGNAGLLSPYSDGWLCTVNAVAKVPILAKPGRIDVRKIVSAESNGTILTGDGTILTWGEPALRYYYDQDYHLHPAELGNLGRDHGLNDDTHEASQVSAQTFIDFAQVGNTTIAIDVAGDLYTWGPTPLEHEPDSGPLPYSAVPTLLDSGHHFTKIVAATSASPVFLALDNNGDIWGYGSNASDILGDDHGTFESTWVKLSTPDVIFTSVATDGASAFALDSDGRLWSWGTISSLQLEGIADPSDLDYPATSATLVDTSIRFSSITGGISSITGGWKYGAIDTDGNVYMWSADANYGPPTPEDIGDEKAQDVTDGYIINSFGELLMDSNDGWQNYGLPPVTDLDPPVDCISMS